MNFRESFRDPRGLVTGRAVGEDDLEVAIRLRAQRLQAAAHRLVRVERRDDHRYTRNSRHGRLRAAQRA